MPVCEVSEAQNKDEIFILSRHLNCLERIIHLVRLEGPENSCPSAAPTTDYHRHFGGEWRQS